MRITTIYEGTSEICRLSIAKTILKRADRGRLALREAIAPELVDNMVDVARFETGVFDTRVTDLERRRYFEMV